jgi:hypothetical protein
MYRNHLSLIVQHRFVAFREKTNQIKPIYVYLLNKKRSAGWQSVFDYTFRKPLG